jgi:hypothetical protein
MGGWPDLATEQHRVVEYSQLRALGLGPEAIRHRARRGRLPIHVTVPDRNKPAVKGVVVHLTRQLHDADWTRVDGIPVTSAARTLVDFAGVARPGELIPAIEQAQRLRLFDMRAIDEVRKLPIPAFNVTIAGFLVDAVWLREKVAVELDSRRHHSGIGAFEGDRTRDTKLQVARFQIVRITDRRLKHEADELEADLRSLLQ